MGTRPVGFIPAVIQDVRKRLKKAGVPDMKIWLGEHGWATGAHCTLCGEACKSKQVQLSYYQNFLKWDLSASDVPSCGKPSEEFDAIDGMPQGLPVTAVLSMVAMMQFPFRV